MGIPARKDDERFTYSQYLNWPDNERWELIDGIPFNMTPAPNRRHQKIFRKIFTPISNFLEGKTCEVYSAPFDVRLPDSDKSDEAIVTVVQPDVLIVCDEKKLDDKGCIGAPDVAIEITSPASYGRDLKDKLLLYEKHGVTEYWIVFPDNNSVFVYRLNKEKKYGRETIYLENEKIQLHLKDGSIEIDLAIVFS